MKVLMTMLLMMMAFAVSAEQNHTCQGGHNCNEGESQGSISNAEATSNSEGGSGGGGGAGGQGVGGQGGAGGNVGDLAALNEGIENNTSTTNTTNTDNRFLSLSLMFPNASGCFKGTQGGGGDGGAAFFGLHLLDSNCWMDKLANQERDVEISARLKCGARKFRNAVAFDRPRKKRQVGCVSMLIESGQALIKAEETRLYTALASQTEEINEHTSDAVEGTRRLIETCTDCYGTK